MSDVYAAVTARIVAALEAGVRPWVQPWSNLRGGSVSRPLRHNGAPYSGINVLMLWIAASCAGYRAPTWMTYRQAKLLGAHVRKGQKATMIVFARTLHKRDEDDEEVTVRFRRPYSVFNVEQIAGLPEKFFPAPELVSDAERAQRHAAADAFVAATGADVRHGGDEACFAPGDDRISMPPFASFASAEGYYSTLLHELVHWTGAKSRLDRDQSGRRSAGDAPYAFEELVAEIGAAFLCADLGVTASVRDDHAAYVASWLRALRDDDRAIFRASTAASAAVAHLHALQDGSAASGA